MQTCDSPARCPSKCPVGWVLLVRLTPPWALGIAAIEHFLRRIEFSAVFTCSVPSLPLFCSVPPFGLFAPAGSCAPHASTASGYPQKGQRRARTICLDGRESDVPARNGRQEEAVIRRLQRPRASCCPVFFLHLVFPCALRRLVSLPSVWLRRHAAVWVGCFPVGWRAVVAALASQVHNGAVRVLRWQCYCFVYMAGSGSGCVVSVCHCADSLLG